MEIQEQEYNKIKEMIVDPDSPVGINAEKTHVIIINLLRNIEKRLDKIEANS